MALSGGCEKGSQRYPGYWLEAQRMGCHSQPVSHLFLSTYGLSPLLEPSKQEGRHQCFLGKLRATLSRKVGSGTPQDSLSDRSWL